MEYPLQSPSTKGDMWMIIGHVNTIFYNRSIRNTGCMYKRTNKKKQSKTSTVSSATGWLMLIWRKEVWKEVRRNEVGEL